MHCRRMACLPDPSAASPFDKVVDIVTLARTRAASRPAVGHVRAAVRRLLRDDRGVRDDREGRADRRDGPRDRRVGLAARSSSPARSTTCRERRRGPFVAINCGALPANLIEAELFGHEKGAFTGANRQHAGCFERAAGGTLFLDEITEMPPDMQVRLLRVLETGRFVRIGGDREIDADVRIIAATNRDPQTAVRDGVLREDLMYRLAVFPIQLPPLRDRDGDAELIAEHFLRELNDDGGHREALLARRARRDPVAPLAGQRARAEQRDPPRVHHGRRRRRPEPRRAGRAGRRSATASSSSIGTPLAELERRRCYATLDHCDGNKRQVRGDPRREPQDALQPPVRLPGRRPIRALPQ